jgi:hypothetical protein
MKGLSTLVSNFYDQVLKYVNGQLSLEKFEHWLVGALDQLLSTPWQEVNELVNTIELNRAEMSQGHRTEAEFKEELRQFLETHPTVTVEFGGPISLTTSSSSAVQSAGQVTVGEGDRRFSYTLL